MIDQHLLLTLSLREHDGTPLQSRLSEREVACWISNRALRPEYRARRGTCDLAVPVATQWHCAHTVVSEAQVPGATEAVEENTTTSVCLVLKVFITVHFGSKLQCLQPEVLRSHAVHPFPRVARSHGRRPEQPVRREPRSATGQQCSPRHPVGDAAGPA